MYSASGYDFAISLSIKSLPAIAISNSVLPSLMFFTFETLLFFGICYFLTIPIALITYRKHSKKLNDNNGDDSHEDIL